MGEHGGGDPQRGLQPGLQQVAGPGGLEGVEVGPEGAERDVARGEQVGDPAGDGEDGTGCSGYGEGHGG